jgi:hypothetical protein
MPHSAGFLQLERLVPAANRFIIAPDALNTLGRRVSVIGRRVFLFGKIGLEKAKGQVTKVLQDSELQVVGVQRRVGPNGVHNKLMEKNYSPENLLSL